MSSAGPILNTHGIIYNQSGFIKVLSNVGEGTAFQIYFPASDQTFLQSSRITG
jgi:hypothetical protein